MNQSSLLDPQLWPVGFYEIGSLREFSRNLIISFSNFWHGDRKPREIVHVKARYFKKILIAPKMGKKGQKWGFFHISENFVIRFGWKWSKMKDHIVIGFLEPHVCQNSGSWDMGQKALAQSHCRILKWQYLKDKIMN